MFKKLAAVAVTALLCLTSVQAADFEYTFTGSNFVSHFGIDAPQSVVSGSFILSGASISSTPTSLKSVDLVVDNHRYTLSELVFKNQGGHAAIGGVNHGLNGFAYATNDFYMEVFGIFLYTSTSAVDRWNTNSLTWTYTEVTAVPEPETYAMLLAGLGLMGFVARRRKNQA